MPTKEELKIKQKLPLEVKIRISKLRIKEWINEFGEEGVYIAFSGGKDSTVLLDLVREDFPSVPAVFVDTGLEYPEIRNFVKTFENVIWLKPKMNFKKIIDNYGYPIISKEVSGAISETVSFLNKIEIEKEFSINKGERADFLIKSYENGEDFGYKKKMPTRTLQLIGKLPCENGYSKVYDKSKYNFLLNAPFNVTNRCCEIMKKRPFKAYESKTGKKPLIATLAAESKLRSANWVKSGCNSFEQKNPSSKPLSIWLEDDVLQYIKNKNLPIASVYGEIVSVNDPENFDGQMDISDFGLIEDNRKLKLTGCDRTGCMFCLYGCHLEKSPNRFERMKITHPKQYEYIMKPKEEGGLGYKEVLEWINKNGTIYIRY